MIVVSDTTPVMNLAVIGRLDLLQQLYTTITIPEAVFHEVCVAGAGQAGAQDVSAAPWIDRRSVVDVGLANSLMLELDEGEAEAITLAIELKADLLLMDERRGRSVAARLGIKHIGLLGALVEAKHAGFIIAVKPILDALMEQAGFWVSPALYAHVLLVTGE
jgi:predicted nucleic acid-binding protein